MNVRESCHSRSKKRGRNMTAYSFYIQILIFHLFLVLASGLTTRITTFKATTSSSLKRTRTRQHSENGLPPVLVRPRWKGKRRTESKRRRFCQLFFSSSDEYEYSNTAVDGEVVPNVQILTAALPPSQRLQTSSETSSSQSSSSERFSRVPPWMEKNDQSQPEQVEQEIKWLEYSMLQQHGFSVQDVSDVVKAIYLCASGDVSKIIGSIEFCNLMLRLEDDNTSSLPSPFFVTKDVLLASVLHYCEGVTARRDGVHQKVQYALGMANPERKNQQTSLDVSPSSTTTESFKPSTMVEGNQDDNTSIIDEEDFFPKSSITLREKLADADDRRRQIQEEESLQMTHHFSDSDGIMDLFTMDALRLAQSASRIKRAEIIADVVLTDKRAITKEEYIDMRNLLLSVMDDWRALAIRCVAYLYRLEGVLHSMPHGTGEFLPRSNEAILAARHSIRIYANLSQRLGLHRLKSQLESSAFRILYPRQFAAVSSLFQQKGESMQAVSTFLASQVTKMLHEDQSLMSQLEDLEINSRVKEPYSFWKKLLRKRKKQSTMGRRIVLTRANHISVIDVQDGVALRVILKARKLTPEESIETTRSRERMLCYYVQKLIQAEWPATDLTRVKDYISKPKANGYQSLHHTSAIIHNNQKFPFEVQVRSSEMHDIAEFGVAAHFNYKVGDKPVASLPPAPESSSLASTGSIMRGSIEPCNPEMEESSYIMALENARATLVQSNIFVFLPGTSSALEEGQLLSLPAGAKVIDCLSELRRKHKITTKDSDFQVWKNGRLTVLDEVVRNGDVLLLQDMSAC